MPYLTLIGGPCPQKRSRCDAKFTAPILRFGGVPYYRQDTGNPDEMVYAVEMPCEHEWSEWHLHHHRDSGSELWRFCLLCRLEEVQPWILDIENDSQSHDSGEPAPTLVIETGLPRGMLSAKRLTVQAAR